MTTPRLDDEAMMTLRVTLHPRQIGRTPAGHRVEVPFEGTATSPHWDGEREASGVDHITVGSNGISRLDVHTIVTEGDETIAYRGTGRGGPDGVLEGVVFETASERLAWMNEAVAVGVGTVDGRELTVDIFAIQI